LSLDNLIYRAGNSEKQAALLAWAENTPGLHPILMPNFNRLQIEKWIWERREALGYIKMDVGQSETPRRWMGDGYFTFGLYDSDVVGDLLNIPLDDDSLDGAILTEVLEHCADPFRAVAELRRVLRPGGLMLLSAPFIWPDHRTSDYPDYWRFTEQAWDLMLKDFSEVKVYPSEWTDEGHQFWHLLRRFECMGYESLSRAASGYRVEARL
jgi:SAM-dependent methyltransferase